MNTRFDLVHVSTVLLSKSVNGMLFCSEMFHKNGLKPNSDLLWYKVYFLWDLINPDSGRIEANLYRDLCGRSMENNIEF